jgi:predicted NBD/HSP70 family sugar kinase
MRTTASPDSQRLGHEGAYRPLDEGLTDFKPYWRSLRIPPQQVVADGSWCFASFLNLTEEELECFKKLVRRKFEERAPSLSAYAFDRESVEIPQLKKALTDRIRQVVKQDVPLDQVFRFRTATVPHWRPRKENESVIMVMLEEHVTAAYMVFDYFAQCVVDQTWNELRPPEKDVDLANGQAVLQVAGRASEATAPSSAWQLFQFLFELARKKPDPSRPDSGNEFILWDEGVRYCPTYLIGQFLHACFVLRPDDCVSLPVRINDGFPVFIHLPKVLRREETASPAAIACARYVPAYVLNKVMTGEIWSCDVGLQDLLTTTEGKRWHDLIVHEVEQNRFKKLLDKYFRDYRAEARSPVSGLEQDPVIPEEARIITDPLAAMERLANCPSVEQPLFLGVDIGGSLVKMHLFEIQKGGRLAALPGDITRIPTRQADKQPYKDLREFCDRIAAEVRRQLKIKGRQQLHAVGINWPGPVRDGIIHGTSGILSMFGFSRDIDNNDIFKIMKLDLAEDMQAALRMNCPVAVVNDGDGHAMGLLLQMLEAQRVSPAQEEADETWAIVKAGTGTAGAVIRSRRPVGGLMEFGKVLVDLGYEPKGNYPEGLANASASAKTLPRLMRSELMESQHSDLSELDPELTSIEVGLLAKLFTLEDAQFWACLEELLEECGAIAYATRHLPDQVDAEEIRRLLDDSASAPNETGEPARRDNWALRGESRRIVEEHLHEVGYEARDRLRDRVRIAGQVRLEAICDWGPLETTSVRQWLMHLLVGDKGALEIAEQKIKERAKIARKCVERLGAYVGDFLALLRTEYPEMDYAVLAGGVFGSTTGETVTEYAIRRLTAYGYNVRNLNTGDEKGIIRFRRTRSDTLSVESSAPDPATMGAAVSGALELLNHRRQEGLKRIRELVSRLPLLEHLVVGEQEVHIELSAPDGATSQEANVLLARFGLNKQDAVDYLNASCRDLGIVQYTAPVGDVPELKDGADTEATATKETRYTRYMLRFNPGSDRTLG